MNRFSSLVIIIEEKVVGLTGFVIIHVIITSFSPAQGERNQMVNTKFTRPVNEMPMSTSKTPKFERMFVEMFRASKIEGGGHDDTRHCSTMPRPPSAPTCQRRLPATECCSVVTKPQVCRWMYHAFLGIHNGALHCGNNLKNSYWQIMAICTFPILIWSL